MCILHVLFARVHIAKAISELPVHCRDLNKQLKDAKHLQKLKTDAQAVITDAGNQEEMHRALRRKLIRANADLDVLLLDDMQACNPSSTLKGLPMACLVIS